MGRIQTFDESNFKQICDYLGVLDADLQSVLTLYNYPPCWRRTPSFETLVHIILEQQVSLASAMAAMKKLKEKAPVITPLIVAALSHEELKACYFSRQKIAYTQHLANAVLNNELNIEELSAMSNDGVRANLTGIKGIGNWTVDVYLMMALHRSDLFPLGDVALMTSIRETKNLPKETSRETIALIASNWKPYQTIAAYILWHGYLCKRKKQ
ncbi:MAG: DNA-3-methyladenine glycosylase 2 family protein [Ferruginibacter sp.]|nr:DNA-3-methyladenine glycosylase 2 family protein [Ferruginibacter sp.]